MNIQIGNSTEPRYLSIYTSGGATSNTFELNYSSLIVYNNETSWKQRVYLTGNYTLRQTIISYPYRCVWCGFYDGGGTKYYNWEDVLYFGNQSRAIISSGNSASGKYDNVILDGMGGGAVYHYSINMEFEDTTFQKWQQALLVGSSANHTLQNCKFKDNTKDYRNTAWYYPAYGKLIDTDIDMFTSITILAITRTINLLFISCPPSVFISIDVMLYKFS